MAESIARGSQTEIVYIKETKPEVSQHPEVFTKLKQHLKALNHNYLQNLTEI